MEDKIHLRRATLSDSKFILELRNDPSARKFFIDSSPTDLLTHKKWFTAKLKDPNDELFVIIYDKERAGQIRFDVEKDKGEISITLAPKFRGRGIGSLAIGKACKKAFKNNLSLEQIRAYIKMDNDVSQKSFVKAGFKNEGEVDFKGCRCFQLSVYRQHFG